MNDLTLARTDLPEGTICAAVGEPYIVRRNLFEMFDMQALAPKVTDYNQFEYTKPEGYDPLVKFLEEKHQAPVIISNGAKQAIGSLFYALKKLGKDNIWLPKPWWSLFPPLIKMHGLNQTDYCHTSSCAQLIVYPNNPANTSFRLLNEVGFLNESALNFSKEMGIPTIHDAAYFSEIYMPKLPQIGKPDVQVYTCSKMLGLSQLRVGYAVYHNTQLYKDALSYMETSTVGLSVLSQMYAFNILKAMEEDPEKTQGFQKRCHNDLLSNRKIVKDIPDSILEPTDNDNVGMFLWTKCHNLNAFKEAKVNVVEGTPFGCPGYIRMNIALPQETMIEVVNRLNN